MPKLISATHHKDKMVVECIAEDGSRLIRSGGSVAWRFNNPGNLRPPEGHPPKYTRNFIGIGDSASKQFFIFPDYETGREQLKAHLLRKHSKHTIAQAWESYAPRNENQTDTYVGYLLKKTGLSGDKEIGEFTASELNNFMDAIQDFEGYNKDAATRQEIWKNSTSVSVTDGARPIADKEIVLRKNGVDTTVKTSATGKLPPIIHNPKDGPIELLVKNLKDEWESVLKIMPDSPSKMLQLIFDGFTVQAPTAAHVAQSKQKKTTPDPMKYVVKSGDTISSISSSFKVSVEDIKKSNPQIKDINKIRPSQIIYLFGSAPTAKPATTVLQSKPASTKSASATTATQKSTKAVVAQPPAESEHSVFTDFMNALLGRSNDGQGNPVAVIPPLPSKQAPWMVIALKEREKWGGINEKVISKTINYHEEIGLGFKNLSTAWCASFVNYCLMKSGYSQTGSAGSQSFTGSKKFIKISGPIYGAIAVFKNPAKPGQGHACFVFAKMKDGDYAEIGGNQGDSITFNGIKGVYINMLKYVLLGYYVPIEYKKYAEDALKAGGDFGEPKFSNISDVRKHFKQENKETLNTR